MEAFKSSDRYRTTLSNGATSRPAPTYTNLDNGLEVHEEIENECSISM